jgi:hypothetical protein
MTKTCPHCNKKFRMGYNGTVDGCDACTGVERDVNGDEWRKGEKRQTRLDIATKKTFYLFRKDVFNKDKIK